VGSRSVKYYIMFYTNVSSNQAQYLILLRLFSIFFPTQDNKSFVIDPQPQETIILLYSHHPETPSTTTFSIENSCITRKIHYTSRSYNKSNIIYVILYYRTQMDGFCRWPWSRSRVLTIFKMPMSRVKCFGHVTRVCGIRQTRSRTATATCTDSTAAVLYTIYYSIVYIIIIYIIYLLRTA